ncbi:GNAT family N-acetyltransferase [Sporosarcina sp. FSL K6-1522]|uniref:GNAT family N-acetyltransferase n=1 Tax=Sporosarcina sp. FSL K6-1522 TaxID=2921554 RepID=UPI003159E4FF
MIKKGDIANMKFAEEVLRVQIPSYLVEAELIDFYEIPPLKDTIHTLQQCEEIFYGYYEQDTLCGAISIKIEVNIIDIHRLMVHPQHFRKGIAKKLIDFISHEEGVDTLIVSTGSKNTPAIQFYQKNGFVKTGETTITEHLSITSFQKMLG